MSKNVEIEQKFYCNNHKKLLEIIKKNGLNKKNEEIEIDEYFTDINSKFIKNRTCLRIRNINNESLELTYKGKSKILTNNYAKIENNIKLDISNYDSIVGLLFSLGYYSYSVVKKKRVIYTKKITDYEYNVMIDNIDNLGDFVEFELLYYKNDKDIKFLQKKLDEFVKLFETLNFESANLPYRDFVANKTYLNILPKEKLTTILFDLDGTLINSEEKFFESFRYVIDTNYNYTINYKEYEENELNQNANLINKLKKDGIIDKNESEYQIMQDVYSEYEKKFMDLIDENEVKLNFELLKQLKNKKLKLALVSTSRRKFIDLLLKKLEIQNLFEIIISRENTTNLKPLPDAYKLSLELLKVSKDNCIALEDSERGIIASKKADIKTIQVNDFVKYKTKETELSEKLSRILLSIINNIGE